MTINLTVRLGPVATDDAALIARALCEMIRAAPEYPELRHPDDPGYTLAIIEVVEVMVG